MKVIYISNFINHHQIPFSEAIQALIGQENYFFIATTPTEVERLRLGYEDGNRKYPFILTTYDKDNLTDIIELITSADLVILGGAPHFIALKLISRRISQNRIIFRASERIFKKGMWRAMTPARIAYMILLHTRYRKKPIYMLSASAYLPYELSLFKAYPEKIFKWGYFPPFIEYEINDLLEKKNSNTIRIVWVGRLISWKHPDYVIYLANRLVDNGFRFSIEIIGTGILKEQIHEKITSNNLSQYIVVSGSMSPEKVRERMEEANILIATSDYNEGWGAVINEAMNSACVVIASHAMGSVPYLINHGENGYIFESGNLNDLYNLLTRIIDDKQLMMEIGKNAFQSIKSTWNASVAADRLLDLYQGLVHCESVLPDYGPCSKAESIPQNKMLEYLRSPSSYGHCTI